MLVPKIWWLDEYERSARLAPGLLALLPVAVTVVAVGLRSQAVATFLAGIASAVGGPLLLASTVRMRGLDVQEDLFAGWGGSPTVAMLRHNGPEGASPRREQWRRRMTRVVGLPLPTAEAERADPAGTDAAWESAVAELRELTRDRAEFPLVFAENKAYGFERNLLGMRPVGVWASIASLVVFAVAVAAHEIWNVPVSLPAVGMGVLVVGGLLVLWLVLPSEDRVHRAARRYAERVLDSMVRLEK